MEIVVAHMGFKLTIGFSGQ